jgi:hypothetical protein
MARDVSNNWTIVQSNGFRVEFDIVQDSRTGDLHGSGRVIGGREANGRGRVDDHSFIYTVDWNNNGRGGQYSGTFGPDGRLTGVTVDLDNPTSQATWFSETTF